MSAFRKSRLAVLIMVAVLMASLVPALSRAEAQGGAIAYGQSVSGQISNATFYEMWVFEGAKGDRVRITMTGSGGLDPYLGLLQASTEEVIMEDDDSGGNSNALIDMSLPADDGYVIIATRYDLDTGTSQGAYELTLEGGAGPSTPGQPTSNVNEPEMLEPGIYYMGDIQLDTPVSGTITNDNFAQLYTVELQAGEIAMAMFADGSQLDSYLIFMDADGNVLAEDDDSGADVGGGQLDSFIQLQVPQAGSYIIGATRAGVGSGSSSGAYALAVGVPSGDQQQQEEEGPEGVLGMGELMLGTPADGALDNEYFAHIWYFSGNAGEMVTITMSSTDGLDSYLGLLDADGNVLAEDDDSGGGAAGLDAQIAIRLPETGDYIVVAARAGFDAGNTTGSYSLTVASGAPQAPTESSGGLGGFGGLPGRAIETEEDTFYLRGFGRSDNPDKATPLEQFLQSGQEEALPGRSFKVDGMTFQLRGYGFSDDPAKMTPLEAFLSQAN